MIYYALASLVVGLIVLAMGFAGLIRGAAGVAAIALIVSVLLFAADAARSWTRRHRFQN